MLFTLYSKREIPPYNLIPLKMDKKKTMTPKKGIKLISVNRVQRLMRKANIKSIIVKKFRPTPSKEKVVERENILQRDFTTNALNEKWVGDITYIHT